MRAVQALHALQGYTNVIQLLACVGYIVSVSGAPSVYLVFLFLTVHLRLKIIVIFFQQMNWLHMFCNY